MTDRTFAYTMAVAGLILMLAMSLFFDGFALTGVNGKPRKQKEPEAIPEPVTPVVVPVVSAPVSSPVSSPVEPVVITGENKPTMPVLASIQPFKSQLWYLDPKTLQLREPDVFGEDKSYVSFDFQVFWVSRDEYNLEERTRLENTQILFGSDLDGLDKGKDVVGVNKGKVCVLRNSTLIFNIFINDEELEWRIGKATYASMRKEIVVVVSWQYPGETRVYSLELFHKDALKDFSGHTYSGNQYNGYRIDSATLAFAEQNQ